MEISSLSKTLKNRKSHSNYNYFDTKEKIQILHKINSINFPKYSFDKNKTPSKSQNNTNILSSTVSSFAINKNPVYKKKLVKHNSYNKNSPNILVLKISKQETKSSNMDKIIDVIKSNDLLKQSIKKELKNEIIKEFLEDITNINEEKVYDFLKIKNILLSSEKIKKNIFTENNSKGIYNLDLINSNIISNSNEFFHNEKKSCSIKNKTDKFIYDIEEIEKKEKKGVNSISPIKTIFNNLFINNNEKYIIKNPFQEHDIKQLNNSKRKKLFVKENTDIQLSNFNFQIIDNYNNFKRCNDSFSDICSKSSISIYGNNFIKNTNNNKLTKENENLQQKEKFEIMKSENKNTGRIINTFFPINQGNFKINKRYFQPISLINSYKEDYKINKINSFEQKENNRKISKGKKEKSINKINLMKINLKKANIKIEDEKRRKLIKKIIEDSKKISNNKNIINDNKYHENMFIIKRNNRKKLSFKGELLNKSVNLDKNDKIKLTLNQINKQFFNTYTDHKQRNKTSSKFISDKNSNIFRICHINKIYKVLKKVNNKNFNAKWLQNIAKKNTPFLCFEKTNI